jgi:uncharacterized membrane protein (UPF0127 family)
MLVAVPKFAFLAIILVFGIGMSACAKPDNKSKVPNERNVISQETADSQLDMTDTEVEDNKIPLVIGDTEIYVEYADTPETRQLGLMYRRTLCEDCGMLFKFSGIQIGSIWMKNTYIGLDLAYIDSNGKVTDIKQLTAHDLTPVKSSAPVLYALEMNQGWFAKQDIQVGDIVKQLP